MTCWVNFLTEKVECRYDQGFPMQKIIDGGMNSELHIDNEKGGRLLLSTTPAKTDEVKARLAIMNRPVNKRYTEFQAVNGIVANRKRSYYSWDQGWVERDLRDHSRGTYLDYSKLAYVLVALVLQSLYRAKRVRRKYLQTISSALYMAEKEEKLQEEREKIIVQKAKKKKDEIRAAIAKHEAKQDEKMAAFERQFHNLLEAQSKQLKSELAQLKAELSEREKNEERLKDELTAEKEKNKKNCTELSKLRDKLNAIQFLKPIQSNSPAVTGKLATEQNSRRPQVQLRTPPRNVHKIASPGNVKDRVSDFSDVASFKRFAMVH